MHGCSLEVTGPLGAVAAVGRWGQGSLGPTGRSSLHLEGGSFLDHQSGCGWQRGTASSSCVSPRSRRCA